MNYIVFDLEATMANESGQTQFIIEIGAVKVEEKEGTLKIADSFHTYVKPPSLKILSKRTLKFIGAGIDSFTNAPRIYSATKSFKRWIGQEEYYLCGWSAGDLWLLANHSLKEKQMDLSWVKNFIDIQPVISMKLGGRETISLKKAVALNNPEKEDVGGHHSAIVDSFSTTKLLIDHFDDIKQVISKDSNSFSCISSSLNKKCKNCRKQKYFTEFKSVKNKKNLPTCKECRLKEREEMRKLNTEKVQM